MQVIESVEIRPRRSREVSRKDRRAARRQARLATQRAAARPLILAGEDMIAQTRREFRSKAMSVLAVLDTDALDREAHEDPE